MTNQLHIQPARDFPRSNLVTAELAGNGMNEADFEEALDQLSETTWQDIDKFWLNDLDPDDEEALVIDDTVKDILWRAGCPVPVAIAAAITFIRG